VSFCGLTIVANRAWLWILSHPVEDPWLEIFVILGSLLPLEAASHTVCVTGAPAGDALRQIEAWKQAETPFHTAIDEAVDKWTIGSPLPPLEGEAGVWMLERVSAATSFVGSLTTPNNTRATPILTAPGWSQERIIKWFLTDWWYTHGVVESWEAAKKERRRLGGMNAGDEV
jgi:hypothetical protein